jgi:hypothetical protein
MKLKSRFGNDPKNTNVKLSYGFIIGITITVLIAISIIVFGIFTIVKSSSPVSKSSSPVSKSSSPVSKSSSPVSKSSSPVSKSSSPVSKEIMMRSLIGCEDNAICPTGNIKWTKNKKSSGSLIDIDLNDSSSITLPADKLFLITTQIGALLDKEGWATVAWLDNNFKVITGSEIVIQANNRDTVENSQSFSTIVLDTSIPSNRRIRCASTGSHDNKCPSIRGAFTNANIVELPSSKDKMLSLLGCDDNAICPTGNIKWTKNKKSSGSLIDIDLNDSSSITLPADKLFLITTQIGALLDKEGWTGVAWLDNNFKVITGSEIVIQANSRDTVENSQSFSTIVLDTSIPSNRRIRCTSTGSHDNKCPLIRGAFTNANIVELPSSKDKMLSLLGCDDNAICPTGNIKWTKNKKSSGSLIDIDLNDSSSITLPADKLFLITTQIGALLDKEGWAGVAWLDTNFKVITGSEIVIQANNRDTVENSQSFSTIVLDTSIPSNRRIRCTSTGSHDNKCPLIRGAFTNANIVEL